MAEQNTTDKLTLAKFEEAYDIVHNYTGILKIK